MRFMIKLFPENKQDVKREMYGEEKAIVVLQSQGNIVDGAMRSVKLIVLI